MKERILEELHTGITVVKFTKSNGELREMKCTLNEAYLPDPEPDAKEKPARKVNPEVQAVWDIEKKAWRSFRWDSIVDENTDSV